MRMILHMNNECVALLEAGHHYEAMERAKAALSSLRIGLQLIESDDSQAQNEQSRWTSESASASGSEGGWMQSIEVAHTAHQYHSRDKEDDSQAKVWFSLYQKAFAVLNYIDVSRSREEINAMLLYNMGLSLHLDALCNDHLEMVEEDDNSVDCDENRRRDDLQGALKVYQHTWFNLTGQPASITRKTATTREAVAELFANSSKNSILISCAILANTSHVLLHLGRVHEARQFRSILRDYLASEHAFQHLAEPEIKSFRTVLIWSEADERAAAAAA